MQLCGMTKVGVFPVDLRDRPQAVGWRGVIVGLVSEGKNTVKNEESINHLDASITTSLLPCSGVRILITSSAVFVNLFRQQNSSTTELIDKGGCEILQ